MVTFLRYMMYCMVITAKRLAEDKYGKCVFVQSPGCMVFEQDQETGSGVPDQILLPGCDPD